MPTQRKTSGMMYLGSQSQPREIIYGTWSWSECLGQQSVKSLWTGSVANQSSDHPRQRMRMDVPFHVLRLTLGDVVWLKNQV
eukprot:799973-Prorocentrum_lima.AAC.1